MASAFVHLLPSEPIAEGADSDAALLDSARLDRAAFAQIDRRYAPDICSHCYHCLGSREDTEDATSQVFTLALTRLSQLQDDNFCPTLVPGSQRSSTNASLNSTTSGKHQP